MGTAERRVGSRGKAGGGGNEGSGEGRQECEGRRESRWRTITSTTHDPHHYSQ